MRSPRLKPDGRFGCQLSIHRRLSSADGLGRLGSLAFRTFTSAVAIVREERTYSWASKASNKHDRKSSEPCISAGSLPGDFPFSHIPNCERKRLLSILAKV